MNSLWKSVFLGVLLLSGTRVFAKNVYWVVPTSADLVARTPASYAASNGDPTLVFLQVVTTSGDTLVGTGARHWKWDANATGPTNTAQRGGPIAWPQGSTTGRWIQTQAASLPKPDIRWMTLPPLFPDPAGGGTNPGNPTSHFQRHIDAASAAYDPTWGRVRLDFPAGTFSCDELIWKGRVIYVSDHEWRCRKRNDSSGMANRSMMRTPRVNGMITDPVDGAFVAWAQTPADYSNPDNWYGLSDDVTITGQGKFVFDQNGKNSSLPLCRLSEIRRWLVDSNCFEVVHNGTPTTVNNWAISVSGRDVQWFGPVVRGGLYTFQDGLHICSGRNITVLGGYLESGDDAVAIEAEAAGGSTSPPDEAAEQITVSGFVTRSNAARAVSICGGLNQINVPYRNGLRVRNVAVTNFTGTCSQTRQSAFLIGTYPWADGIWDYVIDNPGSGYTDGYYIRDLSSTGGGFGAQCHLKVSGGRIVRAVIASVAGEFQVGAGYTGNEIVSLAGMGPGTGARVTGKVYGLPNDRVTGVVVRDFSIVSGGPAHDGIEAFGVNIHGASDVTLGGSIRIIENATTPSHRPFSILSCSNVVLNLDVSGTQKGGSINTKAYPNSSVDELYFRNCTFGPCRSVANGVFKI
ncbi:MAG: hypothetical protein JNL10_00115, partial [Verrucomicrobiales bacterium]|nr:hypothetical protein [Verrucomicrobiales bacterium]